MEINYVFGPVRQCFQKLFDEFMYDDVGEMSFNSSVCF